MPRSLLALIASAGAAGALASPAAAQLPPGQTFKVSAYGIHRDVVKSTVDEQRTPCSGSRGTESSSTVTRFKTRRSTRLRLSRIGGTTMLMPIGRGEWQLTGQVSGSHERSGQSAACTDLNPDGSARWVPWEPADQRCLDGDLPPMTASVRWSSGRLAFNSEVDDTVDRDPLAPGQCPPYATTTLATPEASARVPLSRLRAGDGPIVLRFFDEQRQSTATSTSTRRTRLTVYVTFTPVR